MKNFTKNNWFKIIIAIVLVIILVIYYKNHAISSYRFDTACAEEARDYSQSKTIDTADDLSSYWSVKESRFIENELTCYAEFGISTAITDEYMIYDLTHNKVIKWLRISTDSQAYEKEYRRERAKIFGNN